MNGRIALAPMEGVVDPFVRDVLTRLGGIDLCVTEFIRVTDTLLPPAVFLRYAPELASGGHTAAGVPVVVQLLGSRADMLALNAARAASLGAPGIDLNFGCPAKTVNRHRGGAVMLDTPDDVHDVVKAVRMAVPSTIPVTAKMRLGHRDASLALENACAIAKAGADALTVHARTKLEGYRPPAHWEWIAHIREELDIPVTANGEIWNWDDYRRCRETSGCDDVMIGRGLIARPRLAGVIKSRLQSERAPRDDWQASVPVLLEYLELLEAAMPQRVHGRIKQWLHMMKREHREAAAVFTAIRKQRDSSSIRAALRSELEAPAPLSQAV